MKRTRTRLGSIAVLTMAVGTLAGAWGCVAGSAGRGAPPSERSLRAFERQRSEARMLWVRTHYEVAYGNAPRLLAEVEIVEGARAPFLRDSPQLAGRAELMDAKGRVLYSIGYRPLGFEPPPGKAMLSTAGPTLRLPWMKRATQLRLIEPERGLEVVVPLPIAKAR